MNSVRSQLAEFGIIAAQGRRGFAELAAVVVAGDATLPALLREALHFLVQQIDRLATAIAVLEQRIVTAARADPAMRRLTTIPGVGPLTAHAVVVAIGEGKQFASARDFAAWCGLTRRVDQSADKRRERGISHQGDNSVRKLLVLGASALLRHRRVAPDRATQWQRGILARRPVKVAVVAQAAKNARIAWAMLQSGATYRQSGGGTAAATAA
jgi:transposase